MKISRDERRGGSIRLRLPLFLFPLLWGVSSVLAGQDVNGDQLTYHWRDQRWHLTRFAELARVPFYFVLHPEPLQLGYLGG
jgi:hypothetical protein